MKDFVHETNQAQEKVKELVRSDLKLTMLLKPHKKKRKSSVTVTSWMVRSESVKKKLRHFPTL